ncbi:MAG: NifB/NifX family molybdenum-iron cluster-binding protein [Ignavibacteriaceae bacterium]|jgi:predicted Fe-Mo cluster-binding NifX family protein
MKIAVATNNEETVAGHVGKCRGFLVYQIEEQKINRIELRENIFTHHAQGKHQHEHHGGGHRHARLVEGLGDCNYLIFKSGGWRMIENLQENNIGPILTDEKFADDAVNKFIKGELETRQLEDCNDHSHHH